MYQLWGGNIILEQSTKIGRRIKKQEAQKTWWNGRNWWINQKNSSNKNVYFYKKIYGAN